MSKRVHPPRSVAILSALRRLIMTPHFSIERSGHPGERQLLVDVSTIIGADVRTGIQRVVRAVLGQLVNTDIPGVSVQPIFASRNHGFCKATLLSDGRLVSASSCPSGLQPVEIRTGDIYLGLDLAAQILPAVESQLATWRRLGVSINIVVYDLLPNTQPDWFSPKLVRNFQNWLGAVARQSDRCICISQAVAQSLTRHLSANNVCPLPIIQTIPLGSDLNASFPSQGSPNDASVLLDWMQSARTILAVGTIEPRKGYAQLLDALDHLWQSDPRRNIALLIIGRTGWKTEKLQERIRRHCEMGKRLVWLDQTSDEFLLAAYQHCAGLIAPSYQEGCGLPLIEAAANGAPILARDIPVFREIGGSLFDYFQDDTPRALASRIRHWLSDARPPTEEEVAALPRWEDCALTLLGHLELIPGWTESTR